MSGPQTRAVPRRAATTRTDICLHAATNNDEMIFFQKSPSPEKYFNRVPPWSGKNFQKFRRNAYRHSGDPKNGIFAQIHHYNKHALKTAFFLANKPL